MTTLDVIPICKIVVAGDGGVGKTTLIYRLIGSDKIVKLTPGISIESLKVALSDDLQADIVFWDMGGQKQFRFFQQDFFECANIILLVFDLNRYSSFLNLYGEWMKMIKESGIMASSHQVLVGNKLDLGQSISDEEIDNFAQKYNMPFFKISAKEGQGIKELEQHLHNVVQRCFS
ncbi:MAG: Rab family GTPase [Candidatus Heimdallarchaeaceae archaeon]